MRVVANRVFGAVSGELEESTVHLLLTVSTFRHPLHGIANISMQQLERRDVTSGEEPEDVEIDDDEVENDDQEEESSDEGENASSSDTSEDDEDDEDDEEAEVDAEIRHRVAGVLRTNGLAGDSEDGDNSSSSDSHYEDILLDDEQMMALDEKLAEIFKSRGVGKNKAGTYFCLDWLNRQ